VLQTGEGDAALHERLERAYYQLTATTHRHFSRAGDGWRLTGVAGLDAPTMNRAVVETAGTVEVAKLLEAADAFFGERECSWSVVLSSFRASRDWHSELVARGCAPTTTLDVLARPPPARVELPDDMPVRLAAPDETPRFTEIVMDVFRMPRRFYPALLDMTEAWRRAGSRLYFAEQDGEPCATALMAPLDGVAGIYNVATLRGARRSGCARALMARCLADAADLGVDVVTLQVAPEGFVEPFYLGLGFEPQYRWRFYAPR
jgi:GNAT superfamily N-acetyltransferase